MNVNESADQASESFDESSFDAQTQAFMNSEEGSTEATEDEQIEVAPESEGEESAVEQEGEPVPEAVEESFEISKDLSLKLGDKVTANHLNELKRGYLREADYTRKTTELAKVREEANGVLQTRDAISNDPKVLREVLDDQHILGAFDKQELLNHALSGVGVPPELWANFLEEFSTMQGEQVNPAWQPKQINPEVQELQKKLSKFENWMTSEQQSREYQAQQQQFNQEVQSLDKEIQEVVSKINYVERDDLLMALAALPKDDPRTVLEVAKSLEKKQLEKHQRYVASLKKKKETLKNSNPSGSTVPIMPKQTTEWDESFSGALDYMKNTESGG